MQKLLNTKQVHCLLLSFIYIVPSLDVCNSGSSHREFILVNVRGYINGLTCGRTHFYGKGPQQLFWAGSWAASGKIRMSGIPIRLNFKSTVEPGYNDIGLCDTPSITLDTLWYQLIPHL